MAARSSATAQELAQADADQSPQGIVERFLRALHAPGDVFELRLLGCPAWINNGKRGRPVTWSGHYRDPAQAAADVVKIDATHEPGGCYVTANPARSDLLARGPLEPKDESTTAPDITRRRWLPVDLDPERPAKIAATEEERAAALALAGRIRAEMAAEGWPAPMMLGTGNGALLLFRVDLANDPADDLLTRVLVGLGARFDTPATHVDQAMHDAGRIVRVPGTWNRKGKNFKGEGGIPARPWRRAELLDVPAELVPVSRELLEKIATPKGQPTTTRPAPTAPRTLTGKLLAAVNGSPKFDTFPPTPDGVRGYLERHAVTVKNIRFKGGDAILDLAECPITGAAGGTSVSVIVGADGKISYPNRHDRGVGLTWHDLRDHLEPGYREHDQRMKERSAGVAAPRASAPQGAPAAPGGAGEDQAGKEPPRLVAVSLGELLSLDIPPREFLMDPFLRRKDLCMVFGQRGHGKTWVGIGAACAVASGGAFNSRWIGRGAHRVLFVDGELPLEDVQEKFAVMVRAMKLTAEQEAALLENLRIITPDNQPDLIPDLSTPEGQAAIEPHLDGVALVILDNLSTLCGGAEENDSMAWLPMGGWLLSLRRRNMAAIFVHHAGRNNQARGHSKREDPLDHIIRVQRPPDAAGDSGAHFEVFFTKRRHKFDVKDAQSPFELLLDAGAWALKPLDRAQGERVQELLDLKMSVRDIAAELDMSKSAVQRIKSKGIK